MSEGAPTGGSGAHIRQLAPQVADAIAAGEAVERPASVVKELFENALDAGAGRIEVIIEGGGLTRISVSDDGAGIAPAELLLAVARHATSKIALATDLEQVRSLGFRGEALASVAAVSALRITSRRRGDAAASTLLVRGSAVIEHGAAAAPAGTTVEVRDLFFSTPARLRFLRAPRTESAVAERAVRDGVLTAPQVAVRCVVDDRVVVQSRGGGIEEALRAVYGSDAGGLRALSLDGGVRVHGALSGPGAHRGNRNGLVLVVNGRRVHNRTILAAVEEGYRGLLPVGRHPFGVVIVELDPRQVDVNVHPTKREVRFGDERAVFGAVSRACAEAVGAASVYASLPRLGGGAVAGWGDNLTLLEAAGWERGLQARLLEGSPDQAATVPREQPQAAAGLEGLGPLRALGQVLASWLIAASPAGVVVVDQHAAHEKVLYDALMEDAAAAGQQRGNSQYLLIPALIEVDAAQLAALDTWLTTLERLGFELEPFGPQTIRCNAVPARGRAADVVTLVRAVLDGLDGARDGADRRHRLCALVACHTAVRLGDPLGAVEQQALLDDLSAVAGPASCPHGRPAVLVLDDRTLRQAFRRPVQ